MNHARVIAYYLPQFHPIPENDRWWGQGFTEWTNVAKAKPLFRGHYQPQLPADLGFCDLRLPEVRFAQAELAKQHGIEGFCYWHYWLGNGKRLLERPFYEVLKSGEPDFPFFLAWANHNWRGVWFGAPNRTLIEQLYPGEPDYREHFKSVLDAFTDERYLKVDNKPIFQIYRPREIPNCRRFTDFWRELALKAGLRGIHFVGEGLNVDEIDQFGVDAVTYSHHRLVEHKYPNNRFIRKMLNNLLGRPLVYRYKTAARYFLRPNSGSFKEYPCIIPNWDSTPRLGVNATILHDAKPDYFRRHVSEALKIILDRPYEHRLVYIKSWNEWAEGNYLEPDLRYGRARLEILSDEINKIQPNYST